MKECQTESLKIADIHCDPKFQARQALDDDAIREYAEQLQNGAEFPPIWVYEIDGISYVVDGWHRLRAHSMLNREFINVVVTSGTWKEAFLAALGANDSHGLRRTNDDKRKSVSMALREFPNKSNGAIAKNCRVSAPFVKTVRNELKLNTDAPREGVDGKKYSDKKRKSAEKSTKPNSANVPRAREAETYNSDPDILKELEGVTELLGALMSSCASKLTRRSIHEALIHLENAQISECGAAPFVLLPGDFS